MIPANIEVNLDSQAIQRYVHKQLDSAIQAQLWLVDLDKMAELTCMSKRWLEDEIISDVRMKAIEIRKNRKRWWLARQAFEIINEITSEW
ncbi:hypothetical protein [Lysinibacillus fusiformis]|uniref:hypothetical protein n=1 Tax=Lysinibacillus fusiformis TaxID=28031 RepID=UPI00301B4BD6